MKTPNLGENRKSAGSLAAAITRRASLQTYLTVRFLVDRDRVMDAYRAYAYFRWVDDRLDGGELSRFERVAFLNRQVALLYGLYSGSPPQDSCPEEQLLVDLVANDTESSSGLRAYLDNMMAVMSFDARRRGSLINEQALAEYTRLLATAVTEALHFFVGHRCQPPCTDARYQAAAGAHIAHMLRDMLDDSQNGYFNIPLEYLEAHGITATDVTSSTYRGWVQARVRLARRCFENGKEYLAQIKNFRCRLAGHAYIIRFEWLLDAIENDDYRLKPAYHPGWGGMSRLRVAFTLIYRSLSPIWKPANPIGSQASPGTR